MDEVTRTERLLAQLLLEFMGDRSQEYQIVRLSKAGLSNPEIAKLLETTPATVAQTLYAARSKSKSGQSSKPTARRPRRG